MSILLKVFITFLFRSYIPEFCSGSGLTKYPHECISTLYNYTTDKHECKDHHKESYTNTLLHCGSTFIQCNFF